MDLFNPFLIKKYKNILKKNPNSKIFCPLAQIYRSRKDFEKAKALCEKGLQRNPNYFAGYLVQAQIYKDQGYLEEALKSLHRAKALSPDNTQMYQLYGEIYMEQRDIPKTLSAFKMILFIKPWDKFAQKVVEQLEEASSQDVLTEKSEVQDVLTEKSEVQDVLTGKSEAKDSSSSVEKQKKVRKLQNLMAHVEKENHTT